MAKFKYFTLDEFLESDKAKSRHIDNFPTFEVVDNIEVLVQKVLDPLRQAWGSGLNVSSGYRCPLLNTAVGGSSTSAHLTGRAAGITPANGRIDEFYKFASDWFKKTGVRYDQLIREKDSAGHRWLHIGHYNNLGQQRMQNLTLTK